jgi:hypothetical protein
MSHFISLIFISFFVSVVFGLLMRNEPKAQIIYGVKMFFGLVGFAILAGWLLYFLPW